MVVGISLYLRFNQNKFHGVYYLHVTKPLVVPPVEVTTVQNPIKPKRTFLL